MKKCPACNRTFADDFSFCLEDGALLSAPFDSYKEQETIVKPINAELPPTQFFSPRVSEQTEIPTVVSSKNVNSEYQQSAKIQSGQQSPAKSLGFLFGKNQQFGFRLLIFSLITFLAALYTSSIVPILLGGVLIALYFIVKAFSFMKSK